MIPNPSYLDKRAWDRRILHVDLRPSLSRPGDMPSGIITLNAEATTGGAPLVITDITLAGTIVSFLATGGTKGGFYRLVIRYSVASSPGQMIEAISGIRVE